MQNHNQFGADPDRYIKDFIPAWRRFLVVNWIAAAVLLVWILVLFINLGKIDVLSKVGIFLGIALFIPFFNASSKLKCPNCSCNVFWYTYLKSWGFAWARFVWGGKCPSCGVKLKNRVFL